MTLYQNPFPPKSDRHELWEMLVERDIEAFIQQDWSQVENDFIEEGFLGINAQANDNPDSWEIAFSTLAHYRDYWLKQAALMAPRASITTLRKGIYQATTLRDIEIQGEMALLHKKFDGEFQDDNGEAIIMQWQTLYRCRKVEGGWKIAGFIGYMPYPMGSRRISAQPAKQVPPAVPESAKSGIFSPVLEVDARKLVVISGQVALDSEGNMVGSTIEEQAQATLENCLKQLNMARCTFEDVFKVNVFLTDLENWGRFNEVYKKMMPDPKPVRTAVQAALLSDFLVEVEMWAAKG